MALDGSGIGLSILFEVTRALKSMQERNACFKEGLVLCETLDVTLAQLTSLAQNIGQILRCNPGTLPHAVLPDFVGTLTTVNATLQRADDGVTEYHSNALIGSHNSSLLQRVAKKGKRLLRAKSLHTSLVDIQRDAADAEKRLQHLLTQLCTALKVDEMALKSQQSMQSLIEEHINPKERFVPAFNAPMLPGNTHLDFESRDAEGTFVAPEATLKSFVFISTSSRNVTVARGESFATGRPHPVHGLSGMAGVGKTTALIGLGHEEDVRAHFFHGVLYMSIGANATVGHITTELWKIMSVTGATSKAAAVKSSETLADAIAIAAVWFHGKRVLFLIDDIWPTSTRPEGYLPDLEGLLQGSPHSRMAVSTRSVNIAAKRGSHVDFGARDPCGSSSLAIFMAHAQPVPKEITREHVKVSARSVLSLCAGLPIALSIAGTAIALRIKFGDAFDEACQEYAESIQTQISLHPGVSFLHNAIQLSLCALAEYREKGSFGFQEELQISLSELYVSLCVLENQQFVPISVLARMWNLSDTRAESVCESFHSMSLARVFTQALDGRRQRGLSVHDLHLDFCRENASRSGEEETWHRRLLTGHIIADVSANDNASFENPSDLRGFNILEYKPREWWRDDVPNMEYIRRNLSRHLRCARLELELGATILDLRWVMAQAATGGILYVKNDIDLLIAAVKEKGIFEGTNEPLMSVTTISHSISGIGEMLQEGIRVASQVFYSHLEGFSQMSEWIRRFLDKMSHIVPKPFLVPTINLYRYPVEDARGCIDLRLSNQSGFSYLSTDFSSCDRYCAVAANHDVTVYSLESLSRLKWMKGHQDNVSVVKFSSDASKLVSGSFDTRVHVWDWSKSETHHLILEGHRGAITSLSLSGDDSQIFSGSLDGTVRVWDMIRGNLLHKIDYRSEVRCVSSCPTNELIAVGTRDGYLRCTNFSSGGHVFEYKYVDDDVASATAFGPDGSVLISGTAGGSATSWDSSSWSAFETVSMPGSVTHITFHADGTNALLGSSQGEIRHWVVSAKKLARYNISAGRTVSGLSFFRNGMEIIAAVKNGYACMWSSPRSNPGLDYTELRNNILFDFDLSADGKRAVTSAHDGIIRLWNTYLGTHFAAYPSPDGGSRRLALNRDGTKIASSSSHGVITVWNSELPPSDSSTSFTFAENTACSLSLSPDGSRLLLCLPNHVEIWKLEARAEKLGQVASWATVSASFSADAMFIIFGDSSRAGIWDAEGRQKVFDSEETVPEDMPLLAAKNVIRTCGPLAYRLWPSLWRTADEIPVSSQNTATLTVDNIFNFLTSLARRSDYLFCEDVLVQNMGGVLFMSRLQN